LVKKIVPGAGSSKKTSPVRSTRTQSHMITTVSFPDNGHGAAIAAGFGWRNGG